MKKILNNLIFWFIWLCAFCLTAGGTVTVFFTDLPIFGLIPLVILLLWCDTALIFAAINRIKNINDEPDKHPHY